MRASDMGMEITIPSASTIIVTAIVVISPSTISGRLSIASDMSWIRRRRSSRAAIRSEMSRTSPITNRVGPASVAEIVSSAGKTEPSACIASTSIRRLPSASSPDS